MEFFSPIIKVGEKQDCDVGDIVLNTSVVTGYDWDIYDTISDMWNVFLQVKHTCVLHTCEENCLERNYHICLMLLQC